MSELASESVSTVRPRMRTPSVGEVALMSAGKIVFRGTPDELTVRGEGHGVGDAPLERGYSAVLSASRTGAVAAS